MNSLANKFTSALKKTIDNMVKPNLDKDGEDKDDKDKKEEFKNFDVLVLEAKSVPKRNPRQVKSTLPSLKSPSRSPNIRISSI